MATLETRRAELSDASAMSRLCLELGYDSTEVLMRQRLGRLRDDPDHLVLVASIDGRRVVGWIHAEVRHPLWHAAYAEVSGLVVHEGDRRLGIGRALIERAQAWTRSRSADELRIALQTHREAAEKTFEALGFSRHDEQLVWSCGLGDVAPADTGVPTLVD